MTEDKQTLTDADNPQGKLPVISTNESDRLHTLSLVLSSAGIHHNITGSANNGWKVYVDKRDHNQAVFQINAYTQENENWPLVTEKEDSFSPVFRVQSLLIIACLTVIFSHTGDWSNNSYWFKAGSIDSALILQNNEYYRLLTALTLHADIVHLLGNCILGGFLLHFYFLLLGNGIGIWALLISSIAANYLNVLGHGAGHHSVGFSTAVFSAIGILSALNYRHYGFSRPARIFFPLMAGATMLAFLGSGGERTDLGAHFFGLISGLIIGIPLGSKHIFRLRNNLMVQFALTLSGLTLPIMAWLIALS